MTRPEEGTVSPVVEKALPDRFKAGLGIISDIILRERRNLIPQTHILPRDTDRSDRLWKLYTRQGIFMSNGGVARSFVEASDVPNSPSLSSFNMYRTDRADLSTVKESDMKKFLVEEGLISPGSDKSKLFAAFSLGAHEGFTRMMRCIRSDRNTGMLYPVGGYGLLVRATAVAEAPKYDVHLVDVDREHGEKISISDLEKQAKAHPKAKTLYIESKTMCGAIYSREEMEEIVKFSKAHGMFLILDTAHANMEFDPRDKFPDVTEILQRHNHKDFAIIFTGSKTYGLERARVGFVVFGDKVIADKMNHDISMTLGSMSDTPIEVAHALISAPIAARKTFLAENIQRHKLNMNILIAYIEGVNSPNIDEELRAEVASKIPEECKDGTKGLKLIYKPQGGIQLKVDMSELQNKFFGNIRMFNAEIFSYALHAATDVVTLHSYQLMDPLGYSMRLSFSIEEDIHAGMRKMHDFINNGLTDTPQLNTHMPKIALAEDLIFPSQQEIEENIAASREGAKEMNQNPLTHLMRYKKVIESKLPGYIKLSEKELENAVNAAAKVIQDQWHVHRPKGTITKQTGTQVKKNNLERED